MTEKNKFAQSGKTKNVVGSIVTPELSSLRLILVPVSMKDDLSGPLTKVLIKRWAKVKDTYKEWYAVRQGFKLGNLTTLAVASDTWCIFALCKGEDGKVDAKALDDCFKKLNEMAKYEKASVHVSELSVSELPDCKGLVQKHLLDHGVNTYFYTEKA